MVGEGRLRRPEIGYDKCNTCLICYRGCPAESILPFRMETDSIRGRIYRAVFKDIRFDLLANEKKQFDMPLCQSACPIHQDIRGFVNLINRGEYIKAVKLIRETNPMPFTTAYVCNHPCQDKCARSYLDETVSIRSLEKFALMQACNEPLILKKGTAKNINIAIIGSGPAGLCAAHELKKMGYSITIFEADTKVGGMARWAIPRFLFPEWALDIDIKNIISCGIEIKINTPVKDVKSLFKDGYKAILLAIGLQKGIKLALRGNDLNSVHIGLDLLRKVNRGAKVKLGQNVIILGGGGTACDVARTVRQLGVTKVAMAFPETREGMPALSEDIQRTEDGGVVLYPSRSFESILGNNREVEGVNCLMVKSLKFDKHRLHIKAEKNSEHTLEADTVIFAVGQALDKHLCEKAGITVNKRGIVKINNATMETNIKGVFAAGDAVTGPLTIVEAMASAKNAARFIGNYLA